jgi:hypothetical protein
LVLSASPAAAVTTITAPRKNNDRCNGSIDFGVPDFCGRFLVDAGALVGRLSAVAVLSVDEHNFAD